MAEYLFGSDKFANILLIIGFILYLYIDFITSYHEGYAKAAKVKFKGRSPDPSAVEHLLASS